jgi:hypothetical protein
MHNNQQRWEAIIKRGGRGKENGGKGGGSKAGGIELE